MSILSCVENAQMRCLAPNSSGRASPDAWRHSTHTKLRLSTWVRFKASRIASRFHPTRVRDSVLFGILSSDISAKCIDTIRDLVIATVPAGVLPWSVPMITVCYSHDIRSFFLQIFHPFIASNLADPGYLFSCFLRVRPYPATKIPQIQCYARS